MSDRRCGGEDGRRESARRRSIPSDRDAAEAVDAMHAMDFEEVWNALPQPALLFDGDDRVVASNPAAEAFLSISAAQLQGRSVDTIVGPASRLADLVRRVRAGAVSLADHAVELTGPEMRPRQVDLQAAPVHERPGDVLVTIQPRDFADRMDRSFSHRAAARSVRGMAAMLAHEIKNPLAGISGAAQLLDATVEEDDRELTGLIRDETARIEALLERVEQFGDARPRTGETVNIHDVLERARRSAQAGFAAHVRFVEEYDPSLPPVLGDLGQLIQVFLNLLKNAAEAAPQVDGVVTLKTEYRPGVSVQGPTGERTTLPLQVTVQDNGAGVPEELRRDVFEPFVTSKAGGGGLGLALVSKIVADHGGAVEYDSEPGRTTFRLRLPIFKDGRRPRSEPGSGPE